ncbi:tyrosine/phenylalanine carboxypeptidase domain-containing protein [Parasphingorhabdus sp. JC815]|uniref:tyrosine/phenylalanine carboxypeptidase domain-containing protein n=1 Tax=Parasphingorhabdus sp. JC815 TaxID=3232140 RepID=UPI003458A8B9
MSSESFGAVRADNSHKRGTRLSVVEAQVDEELARMDSQIDWLTRLTPVNINAIKHEFIASGYRNMPDSEYGEGLSNDAPVLRRNLFALPIDKIENSLIEALLLEKQRELDRQIELVRMRDREGFILASVDLFGSVDEHLLEQAQDIMSNVPNKSSDKQDSDANDFANAARKATAFYSTINPDFTCDVIIDPNPGTALYTSFGNLHIATDYQVAHSRIAPLIQHEIGTHVVTRHNGRCQPLHTLAGGLADYDELQEGLAVLAEYLAGYLPADRLRVLAARVIAAHMAVDEFSGADIYACFVDEFHMESEVAFDTALRAKRGGGLTKDALYLKGLSELLAYLHHDGELEILFLGKFALKQLHSLEKLLEQGIILPPDIIPQFLFDKAAQKRLQRVRSLPLHALYQESPENDQE